jgi:eukaryotic-like serine/threonine-protein kinase
MWRPDQQLQAGKYIIREVIGVGRLSVTYRAEMPDGRSIVIKAPNADAMQPEDFARLQKIFRSEAFKLVQCKHPHIVKVEEPFEESGICCIPMEYIAGRTLAQRDRPILPEAEAIKYVQQIGEALSVVHQNGLLHRDICPANIMLRIRDGQSEAVLIDFGLARDFNHDLTETRTEEIRPGYTPLELYSRQAKRGAFTDIYSLGATLYNLVTGKAPTNVEDRRTRNIRLDFPENLSSRVKRAIQWGMELAAEERPQTVQDWLNSLQIKSSAEAHKSEKSICESSLKKRFETWQLMIAAIAAVGALLGGLQGLAALMQVWNSPKPTQTSSPSASPTQTIAPLPSPTSPP